MTDSLFWISTVLLWAVLAALSVVVLTLLRSVRELQDMRSFPTSSVSLEGTLIGKTVPSFSAVDTSGNHIESDRLQGKIYALAFVSLNCPSCFVNSSELEAIRQKAEGNVLLFCQSSIENCLMYYETLGVDFPLIVDSDNEFGKKFQIDKTPAAVLVGADGRIEKFGNPMRREEFDMLPDEAFEPGMRPTFV